MLSDFTKAIKRLNEVLNLEANEIVRDSAIKRFEICFDLAWKAIKVYAKKQGLECYSPRECFKTAFRLKLIDYQEDWLKMIDDRNAIVHVYAEEYADQVYAHLGKYLELFENLTSKLAETKEI